METSNQPKNQVNEQAEAAAKNVNEKLIKNIMIAAGVVLAVALVAICYVQFWAKPQEQKAMEAISEVDYEVITSAGDSAKLAAATKKYEAVASQFGGKVADRAALQVAIQAYADGKYQECINALADYSSTGSVVADAGAKSLEGDCYVNLKKYEEALKCFDNAISVADGNPELVPYFMSKQARVYHEMKDYAKELEAYEAIKADYLKTVKFDVDLYIERAKALVAGK